ncbi:hypothetical protein HK100_001128 [Physocladia obscura]|uniref:Mitochondrial carrier n=1 Tax=Physocladia obscura TaxID=109957 RepID=A0AAD5SXF8_9FUNG|nr:hypothetical protein HK100_001128 [Physocladia obscura]
MDVDERAMFGEDNNGRFALAKFAAGIFSSPAELVSLLRMVQYCPSTQYVNASQQVDSKRTGGHESDNESVSDHGNDANDSDSDAEDQDISDGETEVEPDAYDYPGGSSTAYGKNAATTTTPPFSETDLESINESAALLKNTDSEGYIIRSGGNDENDPTRPPFEISVVGLSTFQAISKIIYCESEGFWSLWKGLFITWFHEMTHFLLVQPSIEQSLNDAFDIRDDTIPTAHLENPIPTLATLIASHALSGILLSPLELVRTRIMVQTSNSYHQKYKTTSLSAITQIVREEGPGALYFSRRMGAMVLLKTLTPLFKYASPLLVERVFGIEQETRPIVNEVAMLGMEMMQLLILMPIETVLRRLECQVVGRFVAAAPDDLQGVGEFGEGAAKRKSGAFSGMVRVNAIPYTGMWNCARRIILEEGTIEVSASSSKNNQHGSGSSGPNRGGGSESRKKRGRKTGKWHPTEKGKQKNGGWFAPISGLYRGLRLRMYVNVTVSLLRAFAEE